jgi:cyclase
MLKTRVIPCLLLKNKGLVKTVQFKEPRYVGDPINAVWIFNQKEVDELIFLDIMATKEKEKKKTSIELISKISDECFMPLTVGGGIRNVEDIKELLNAGAEKVSINTYAVKNPSFIKEASGVFGTQSIVVSIDVKRHKKGLYEVFTYGGTRPAGIDPVSLAVQMEAVGAGEILINSIDRDGTMEGYDIELIREVSDAVNIPVIACGGAGNVEDFARGINVGHASAVAAGSFFVFHGRRHAVLINFPTREELEPLLGRGGECDENCR